METDKLSYIDDIGKHAAESMRITPKTDWTTLSVKLNAPPKGFKFFKTAIIISAFVGVASITRLTLFSENQSNKTEKNLTENRKNDEKIDVSAPYSMIPASKLPQKKLLPYNVYKPTVLTKIKIVRKRIVVKRKIYITDTIHIKNGR